mmetsp:Transcript_28695/g.52264  ORF Transcript_28695/g.52264 Transcript_28695/m.52264 type:complete len:257 (+) Transcript_28695:320-1090(+)
MSIGYLGAEMVIDDVLNNQLECCRLLAALSVNRGSFQESMTLPGQDSELARVLQEQLWQQTLHNSLAILKVQEHVDKHHPWYHQEKRGIRSIDHVLKGTDARGCPLDLMDKHTYCVEQFWIKHDPVRKGPIFRPCVQQLDQPTILADLWIHVLKSISYAAQVCTQVSPRPIALYSNAFHKLLSINHPGFCRLIQVKRKVCQETFSQLSCGSITMSKAFELLQFVGEVVAMHAVLRKETIKARSLKPMPFELSCFKC